MRRVILTVGPQYAGKSTFCKKIVAMNPEIRMVSRDEVLVRIFGSTMLDPYSDDHLIGWQVMWEEVKKSLGQSDCTLILDAWNVTLQDRQKIAETLRDHNFERVEAWHFVTPLETCIEWSFLREPIEIKNEWSKMRREMRVGVYCYRHKFFLALRLETEKVFDAVRKIDARDPVPEDIFFEAASK